MKVQQFLEAVERLTGTELKEVQDADRDFLRKLLADDGVRIDCSQFNELLLLVNKDRTELPFFNHFFGKKCRVRDIVAGVGRFQKTGMLRYGNFVWAYRTLSRIRDPDAFKLQLGEFGFKRDEEIKKLKARPSKLLEIEAVARRQTVLLGYLSSRDIVADNERCKFLTVVRNASGSNLTLNQFKSAVARFSKPETQADLVGLVERYARVKGPASMARLGRFLADSSRELDDNRRTMESARSKGKRNQEIYLTWDHMDIYFATSMRKPWEFHDLFDFIQRLMATPRLKELELRYFDPTQSFTLNRINKGLLESLMLKRATCTVYSVQDTDTLGKDSELAATLAQGKPVIAYVPDIDVRRRTVELAREEPSTISERLKFVLYADDSFGGSVSPADYKFIRGLNEDELSDSRIWRSVPDRQATQALRARLGQKLRRLCGIIAAAEKRIYDGRARTLSQSHPLALQVNLETGVANGVLVVRNVERCSRLLRSVIAKAMDFELDEDDELWYLRERISGCVYRVVTKDRKLSNCFWNFYLR